MAHQSHCCTATFLRFGKSFEIILNRNSPPLMLYHHYHHSVLTTSGYVLCIFKISSSAASSSVGALYVRWGTIFICQYFLFLTDIKIAGGSIRAHAHIFPQQLTEQQSVEERVSCLQSDIHCKPGGQRLPPSLTGQLDPNFSIKLHCEGRCS